MKAALGFLKLSIVLVSLLVLLPALSFAQHYTQTNLVADRKAPQLGLNATFFDPHLKNPWGMARSSGGPWWISDNNSGVSTVYDGTGALKLTVKIPGPNGSKPGFVSAPTGIIFNGSNDFEIVTGDPNTAAAFIFVTEDGTISAWAGGPAATLKVDNSANPTATDGAVYKGATIGELNGSRFLYVANFRSGKVEVYDTDFNQVNLLNGGEENFDDDRIPAGYAPFNIQNIGGNLFVTYARQNATKHDDVAGDGFGFVDLYSTSGKLLTRFEHGSFLNAPWGIVWAPRDFGEFSNTILVGNFGSGWIAAYNGFTGRFMDFVKDHNGNILTIDGLWGLTFGNSATGCPGKPPAGSNLPQCGKAGPYNSLFFTAGTSGEKDGLFGTITPDQNTNELDEGDEL